MAAVEAGMQEGRSFIAVAQRDPKVDEPGFDDLYDVGTVVKINRIEKRDKGEQVIDQGDRRVKITETIDQDGYIRD